MVISWLAENNLTSANVTSAGGWIPLSTTIDAANMLLNADYYVFT